jgi:hypothetical protein
MDGFGSFQYAALGSTPGRPPVRFTPDPPRGPKKVAPTAASPTLGCGPRPMAWATGAKDGSPPHKRPSDSESVGGGILSRSSLSAHKPGWRRHVVSSHLPRRCSRFIGRKPVSGRTQTSNSVNRLETDDRLADHQRRLGTWRPSLGGCHRSRSSCAQATTRGWNSMVVLKKGRVSLVGLMPPWS